MFILLLLRIIVSGLYKKKQMINDWACDLVLISFDIILYSTTLLMITK